MSEKHDDQNDQDPARLEEEMQKSLAESETLANELEGLEKKAEDLLRKAGEALEQVVEDSEKE